jgi:hypothetical protein
MKTFHVSILFATSDGPLVKTYTIKAATPNDLNVQVHFLAEYDCKIGQKWITIESTEIKDSVELALAN